MKFNKHGIAKTFKFESLLDRHHGYVGRPTPEVITQMEWSRNNSRF